MTRIPGFSAVASLEKKSNQYRTSGARMAPVGVTPLVGGRQCPPGSDTAGCPRNYFCAEPGGLWPICHCLRCWPEG